jgi:transposase
VNQRGDKVKEKSEEKEQSERRAFVYTFCLIDLDTKMYLCYGTGMRSEKEAFKKAMRMLGEIDVRINSVRLDKYYTTPALWICLPMLDSTSYQRKTAPPKAPRNGNGCCQVFI